MSVHFLHVVSEQTFGDIFLKEAKERVNVTKRHLESGSLRRPADACRSHVQSSIGGASMVLELTVSPCGILGPQARMAQVNLATEPGDGEAEMQKPSAKTNVR